MLIVNNVSKRYKGSDKNAVDCLNLKVEPGEVFGFIGPNGAGKTTTIKMIVGLLKSDSGTIHINGYDITKEPRKAKANFGYIPDNAEVYERLKGIEYLNLVADFYGVDKKTRVDKIIELSERFELKDYLNSTIKCYSRGTKQKLVILGAVLHEPGILIMDEPLVGLDPNAAKVLKDFIVEYSKSGKCVFFSTHILEVAQKICSRIGIINKGKLIIEGGVKELLENKNSIELEDLFIQVMK